MERRSLEVIGVNGEYILWDHYRKCVVARCYNITNAALVKAALERLK